MIWRIQVSFSTGVNENFMEQERQSNMKKKIAMKNLSKLSL